MGWVNVTIDRAGECWPRRGFTRSVVWTMAAELDGTPLWLKQFVWEAETTVSNPPPSEEDATAAEQIAEGFMAAKLQPVP